MKKIASLLLCLIMIFSLTIPVFAASKNSQPKVEPIKVKLCNYIDANGKWVKEKYIKFDVNPQIIDGRTMVPIRAVAEELGYNVSWVNSHSMGRVVGINKSIVLKDITDVNSYLDKNTQFKDFIYLIRQLKEGKNPTSFELGYDTSYQYDIKKPSSMNKKEVITVDSILYNSKELINFGCNFYLDSKYYDTCVELVGFDGTLRNIMEFDFNLDIKPQIINDRTLVPLRAAGELLGLQVEWDNDTRTVIMTA